MPRSGERDGRRMTVLRPLDRLPNATIWLLSEVKWILHGQRGSVTYDPNITLNAALVAAIQAAAPMQIASSENPSDHSSVCVRSVKNGARRRVRREVADIEHRPHQLRFRQNGLRLRDHNCGRVLAAL
jgi:hypothetical protein